MKAILAVTCIFSAVVLISALSREECEAPYATPSCDSNAFVGDFYYFNNNTGRCEYEFSCDGPRNFPSKDECRNECPYERYSSSG
uniref:Putative salivary kunitz domain protein n=1 Tax=Ixodes ricinus TaxID=34613 RepID=A0A0K8R7Y0_IXORI